MFSSQSAAACFTYNSDGEGGGGQNVERLGGDPRPEPLRQSAVLTAGQTVDSKSHALCLSPKPRCLVFNDHSPPPGMRMRTTLVGSYPRPPGSSPTYFLGPYCLEPTDMERCHFHLPPEQVGGPSRGGLLSTDPPGGAVDGLRGSHMHSPVQQKDNVSRGCNFTFSSSHIIKSKKKQVELLL